MTIVQRQKMSVLPVHCTALHWLQNNILHKHILHQRYQSIQGQTTGTCNFNKCYEVEFLFFFFFLFFKDICIFFWSNGLWPQSTSDLGSKTAACKSRLTCFLSQVLGDLCSSLRETKYLWHSPVSKEFRFLISLLTSQIH